MTIAARLETWRNRGQRVNARREVRRSLGWPSGRQWRKMRKFDQRQERALALRARAVGMPT